MEMLVIHLLVSNKNAQELFDEVTYKRNVQGESIDTIESDDFFLTLFENGIRSKSV